MEGFYYRIEAKSIGGESMKKEYKEKVRTLIFRIKKFMLIMMSAARTELIFSTGLSILMGIFFPVSLWISKLFINELVESFTAGNVSEELVLWMIVMFAVAIAQALMGNVTELIKTRLADKVSLYITEDVLQKAVELPMTDFDDSDMYNKIQLTIQETPDRCLLLISCLESLIRSAIQMTGVLGLLLNLHWMLGIIPALFLIPFVKFRHRINEKWFQSQDYRMEKKRYSDEMKNILLKNENIKEIRLFGIADRLIEKAVNLQKAFDLERFGNEKKCSRINMLTIIADGLYSLCVKLWIIFESLNRNFTVGSVSMYIAAIDTYGSAIENIMQQYSLVMEEMLYIGYICEIDERRKEEDGLNRLEEEIQKIEFRNVSFRYRNASKNVLEHISMVLEKNHLYALVGVNGSGKTTLIKLLMKLYIPSEGEILVNGKNIAEISGKSLREQMTAVFQDFIKYPFSALENIALNDNEEEESVRKVAGLIGLDETISTLENGYYSQLNCEWKGGLNLSGGQWQKVALARCLYKNASFYIFDEPFAWVDHIAEEKIIKTMATVCNGKIGVLVSHQFDAMPGMSQIYVLEQGKIVENGTHTELVKMHGRYYQLLHTEKHKKIDHTC